jgi:dipeptidyl aminopeptidase/acylaminoacyl peptidase
MRARIATPLFLAMVLVADAPAFGQKADTTKAAQAADRGARPLADFAKIKNIKSIAMSPDGKTIACTVAVSNLEANKVATDLWLLPAEQGEPRRLDLETDSVDQFLWSPKGNLLAIQGPARDTEENCLWVVDPAEGKSRRLVIVERGNHYLAHQGASLCWSPDGGYLAYLAADPESKKPSTEPLVIDRIQYKTRTSFSDNRRTHIWTVDVAAGKPRQVTFGNRDEHSIDWSPYGDEIVFCSNREPDADANWNNDLAVVKLIDGSIHFLARTAGNEMAPVWGPDAQSIAYTMTTRPRTTIDRVAEDDHVWVINRKTGEARELTATLDRRCSQVRWSADGKNVYCLVRDHGNKLLYRIAASGGETRRIVAIDGTVSDYSLPLKGRGGCVLSTPTKPAEVYTFAVDGGDPAARTTFNADAIAGWQLTQPRRIECKSFDGTPIEGWLLVPPGATPEKKAPVILNIHGGPHGMHGSVFSPTFQLLCDRGYAVLYLNPRGSNGYGQNFADGSLNDWGGGDYKDLIAGLDHALAVYPELDWNRLGVTGGSYGGYMTNWAIAKDNRFKAAVSYAGLSNLISFYATSLYQDLIHVEFGGMPWDRYDILWDRSPMRLIKRVQTPTLILHGEADNDVHISQAEELYTALRWRGVESVFVRYPRQGHGATEPRQQLDMLERTVAWFDRHLRK